MATAEEADGTRAERGRGLEPGCPRLNPDAITDEQVAHRSVPQVTKALISLCLHKMGVMLSHT